ncbi:hypothetical protein RN001_008680 [Aquatica leii]|uniref:Uncharacterized protein n=1 Tax=Aquatica leii TaxID=1421715 RepID=A0AAN7PXL3_9COLE|nr:hypothetical protein RN001_008680 [Aquatica leii]
MEHDPRIKLNVFEGETTYLNDYRKFKPDKRYKHNWPKDRTELPVKNPKEFIRDDPESFIQWKKEAYIPFHLMIQPRPIIDTSPTQIVPRSVEKPIDAKKEEVIKTRPRLYISPAVSIDDVPDADMRKLLCAYMYSTATKKSSELVASKMVARPVATTTYETGRDPVKFFTEINPPLPLGWREKGIAWDHEQRRALVDPTETFWINKGASVKCGACTNPFKGTVPQEVKNEINDLINKDNLRMPHDYPIPGYAGFKPRSPQVIPLAKTELPVVHPFLSTAQAITQRWKDDMDT